MTQKNIDPEIRQQAVELYEEGARAWQDGQRGKAMTLYARSAELWPDGPGFQALQMSRDIMNFYDTNQFNP